MGVLENILSNLNLTKIVVDNVIQDSTKTAEDENKRQLRIGMRADNNSITPIYNPSYNRYKTTLSTYNAPSGTPDLFLTGAFQKSITAFWDKKHTIKISATDGKTSTLVSKYSENIFGLNTEAQNSYTAHIYTDMTNRLKKLWK